MPQTLFYYNASSEPLWGESITLINPPGGFANPWLGYPGGNPYPTTQNPNTTYPTAGYYETVPLHVKNTYVEQWNLTLQKQVGIKLAFEGQLPGQRNGSPLDRPGVESRRSTFREIARPGNMA